MALLGFRFFDETFQPGYVVQPHGDHLHKLSRDQQRAELAIRRGHPNGARRANAVFVFEARSVAEALLGKASGKYLYEVEVGPEDVIHRGDLEIYDEVVEALKHGHDADPLIAAFWASVERPSPRMELTVAKVKVRRKLAAALERAGAP